MLVIVPVLSDPQYQLYGTAELYEPSTNSDANWSFLIFFL